MSTVSASRIVLIDDDRNILTSVSMVLESEGYRISTFNDGESGFNGVRDDLPDLIVMDIKMPRMNGLEVLEKLREFSDIPVILLTSKDDEIDEILGLRMGADDYITKPFSQRLLIERIRSLLRRKRLNSKVEQEKDNLSESSEILVCGSLKLDDSRHLCLWKDKSVNLTVTEYLLLKALVLKPGHVKNRDQLIDAAYGENMFVDDRTIDSHVKRVRKKLKIVDSEFNQIETLYGVGYRYKEEADL